MRKTAAWNVMGVDRSTQTVAEEAARRAGMSLADWLDEVVAEQAAEQGVAAEDLTEDDRLDAIGERLDQLSRRERGVAAPRVRRDRARDDGYAPEARASNDGPAEARLEAAIAKFDSRAARNEERTAKALDSMAQWMERAETERARERARQDMAKEGARAEPEGPKTLARSRLDLEDAVQRIQRRRGELDARHGVERRPAPRETGAHAVPNREEAPPAPAIPPQSQVAVEALREEIAGLKSRLDRFARERASGEPAKTAAIPSDPPVAPAPGDRRLSAGESEALRGELAAMRRALGELAPREANGLLEGAVVDLGRRLEAMRKAAVSGESLRPLEEMLRQVMELLRLQDPRSAAKGVENDLKALSGKIDALGRAAVDPALIEQIRGQTEDVRQMLAKAAQSAPIAKLERQIELLAERTERLGNHAAPRPEIERLVAMFGETRAQIERAISPAFLKTIEQRLEGLSKRVDEALQRPAPTLDARPLADLARRFDELKGAVERQTTPAGPRLEAALAEIGRKLDRPTPAPALDARPFEELARRVDGLKSTVERQAATAPANLKLEAALAEIARKLDRPIPAPTLDARPFEELARRVEGLRGAVERQAAAAPVNPKLEAALAEIGRKLDRPAPAPTLDAAPFEELARRVEGLKGAVERQASMPVAAAGLEATLAEIGKKLERIASAPTLDAGPIEDLSLRFETLRAAVERQAGTASGNAKLDAALDEIAQKLDRVAAAPSSDARPIEELARRLEGLRSAFERQAEGLTSNAKLEAGLGEIDRKLERLAAAPTLDPRAIEALSRRLDSLATAFERQEAAPSTAGLEAGLAEIGSKLERLSAAPALDTRPIEELSQRFDSLKSAVERQAAAAPANASIEAALADLSRKLDRPAPALDARPIEDLAQQIEGLRAAVEHQGEVVALGEKLEAAIAEIGRKLDRPQQGLADQMAIKSTLQALSARVEDGFRKIGSAPPDSGRSVGALELELLDEIARRLEEMRGAMDRQGDLGASASRLEAAIADLSSRMESASDPASDRAALNETLQLLISRLRDWGPTSASGDGGALNDLTARMEALHASVEGHSAIAPQLSHLSAELAEIRERLPARGQSQEDARALLDVVQELSDKIDNRDSSNADLRAMETLAREVLAKPMRVDTSSIEQMIEELGHKMEATAGANFDLAPLVDWMAKIEGRLEAVDPAPFAQAVRDLGERIDAREPGALDPRQIEEAATLIARRLEPQSVLGADAELLLQHLAEIHERLDGLGGASGSSAALEKSVADLAAEFENTRELLASVVEPAALASGIVDDLAEMKTENASAERRMSTRLTRVQEILEQLSDRLRLIEEGQTARAGAGPAPAAPPPPATVAANGGFDFNDIPDRPRGAAGRLAAAVAAPPAAPAPRPVAETSGLLLEPGAGAPRGKGKRPEEPSRAADDEDAPKPTDLQAHIAAARRAAMAEMNARREQTGASADGGAKRGGAPMAALKQAQGVVANRRVPFLIGATLLVAAATAAIYELRGGRLPLIQKSELAPAVEAPLTQASPAANAPRAQTADAGAPKIDYTPTGAVDPGKSPESAVKPVASGPRAPADLVSAIPEGQPVALAAAAAAGDPSAETEMGLRFVEGRGLARDAKIGARWLELAANQGVVYAQYRIGALYERGVGVAKDAPLARAWYKKAAEGGNARAMHNLAVMNAEDSGNGKPDYAEAADGFRGAGQLGVHDSQYNLGVLYGRGLGVPQDLPQAWMWFSLASQQGDADASKKRDEIAAKLDAAQLAAAAKLLADFKPKTPSPAANEAPQPTGGWDPKPQAAKPAPPVPKS